ncbi:MAG: PEP-CTERM sorting domain-containing protein [Colwellia sp.]|nr:PEP-CTERM sorting domain-containing protein [Colwellia sp.]
MTGWLDADTTIILATIYFFASLGYIINPDYYSVAISNSVEVPEPATLAIFALALLGLRARRTTKV